MSDDIPILDDRAEPLYEPSNISKIAGSIRLNPANLPSLTVKDRIRGQEAEQRALEIKSEALHRQVEIALAHNKGHLAAELKERLDTYSRQWQQRQVRIAELKDGYQESLLNERQIAVLGNKRRLFVKEIIILVLIFVVLGFVFADIAYELTEQVAWTLFWFDTAICAVFLTNFFFELSKAESKKWYWRTHWIDFLTSIPIPPVFGGGDALRSGRAYRMVRMLRMFRALQALRVLRVMFFFWRGLEQIGRVMNVRLMKRSLLMMLVIIFLGGVVIEMTDGQSQQIAGFWDRIWWSFTTTVTGGFADIYNPNSSGGRFLTVVLIIAGMVIVGVFTATLTSVLIREDNESLHELELDMRELRQEHKTFQDQVLKQLSELNRAQKPPDDNE